MAKKKDKCIWTDDDIAYLEAKAGAVPMSTLTKKLQRTEGAIRSKCCKEGIPIVRNNIYLQFSDVARLMGVDNKTVWRWADIHNMPNKRLNLNFKDRPYVEFDELVKWLEKNQDKWFTDNLEMYALGKENEWLKEKRRKDLNRKDKKNKKRWTDAECMRVYTLLQAGKTWEQIAEDLQRAPNAKTIQAALYRYNRRRKKKELDKKKNK